MHLRKGIDMKKIILVLMAVLCLNACEKKDETPRDQVSKTALQKQEVAVVEQPVVEPVIVNPEILKKKNFILAGNKGILIGFDNLGKEFFGRVVNNYFGKYEASEGKIKLEVIGTTRMLGSDEEMQKEQRYFDDLATVDAFAYRGKTLILTGPKVKLEFEELPEQSDL